ncbi:MAG: CapA family protein [Candidatus Brocadiia bacterium]
MTGERGRGPAEESSGRAPAREAGDFPYAYTPLARPRYARFRGEGRSVLACLWHGAAYLRKYLRKYREAPPQEVAYFRRQRQLLDRLAAEEPAEALPAMALVGDLMWTPGGAPAAVSPGVLAHLNRHDAVLGNLETVVSPRFRVARRLPDVPRMNADPALLDSFRRPDGTSTFAALSVANNHVTDYGEAGVRDTLRCLDERGILHAGVREGEAGPPYVVFPCDGVRIGFHAAAWGVNRPLGRESSLRVSTVPGLLGEAEVDLGEVEAALAGMAEAGAELRIVSLHWGYEFEVYPDPRLMRVGREVVRAGADVVMGAHPHVVQPSEVCFVNGYERRLGGPAPPPGSLLEDGTGRPRKALLCHSLGGFVTAMFTFLCRTGLVLGFRLRRDPETGAVDWCAPQGRLVYNAGKEGGEGRWRLMFLDAYLRARRERGPLPRRLEADLAFLAEHVAAPDVQGASGRA